jgi:hypothetical protein
VPEVLLQSPWVGAALAGLLYSSDYVLTLISARLYETRGKERVLFEGSFELNPILQKDVDSGRWFSWKWLLGVGTVCLLFPVLWSLCRQVGWQEVYLFVLGGMLFLQLALHSRHLRNLFLFSTAFGEDGIRGRIEYPRWVMLATSAFEFLTFAGVLGIASLVSGSVMLMGGAAFCLLIAAKHYALRRRVRATSHS